MRNHSEDPGPAEPWGRGWCPSPQMLGAVLREMLLGASTEQCTTLLMSVDENRGGVPLRKQK